MEIETESARSHSVKNTVRRGYGAVVRQTKEWMNEWMSERTDTFRRNLLPPWKWREQVLPKCRNILSNVMSLYAEMQYSIRISLHMISPHYVILTLHYATVQGNVSNTRKNSKLTLGEYRSSGPHRVSRDEADFESPCYGLCRHDQWLTMALPCNSRAHGRIAGPPSCTKITDFKLV